MAPFVYPVLCLIVQFVIRQSYVGSVRRVTSTILTKIDVLLPPHVATITNNMKSVTMEIPRMVMGAVLSALLRMVIHVIASPTLLPSAT